MAKLTKTQDLYHAFLCHQNIFKEIDKCQIPEEVTGVFNQKMEWLQDLVRMNGTHPELKSEIAQSTERAREVNKLLGEPTQAHLQWQNYVIEERESKELFEDIIEHWLSSASDNNDTISHDITNL